MHRARTSPSVLLVVAAGIPALAACGPSPFALEVRAAQEARARGDLAGEATHADAACRLEPGEKEACAAAADAVKRYKEASLTAAKGDCEAGQVARCVAALAGYRALRPEDAELLALLDGAGRAHAKECLASDDGKGLDGNVVAVVCLEEAQLPLSISTYDALVAERRQATGNRLAAVAKTRTSGERWFFDRTAQCLWADAVSDGDMAAAEAEFRRTAAIPIAVSFAGPLIAGDGCGDVQRRIGPRAACGGAAQPAFTVSTGYRADPVEHTFREEWKTVRYKAGTRQVPNPRRADLEREYQRAEGEVDDRAAELRRAESSCQSAGRNSSACYGVSSAQSNLSSAESRRSAARSRYLNEPQTITEDVFADGSYRVRYHLWTFPSTVTARLGSGQAFEGRSTFRYEDVEQEPFAPAGVPGDPLQPPSNATWASSLRAQATEVSASALDRAFNDVASCKLEGASLDAPGLECRVRSNFYTTHAMPSPTLWLGRTFRCAR